MEEVRARFGRAHRSSQGLLIALKKLRVYDAQEGVAFSSIRVIEFLKNLRHQPTVPMIDTVYDPNVRIFIVEPLLENGLAPHRNLTSQPIQLYSKQLLEGVAFLHTKDIVHRDLKPGSLLISKSGHLKIADLRAARSLHRLKSGDLAQVEYTAFVVAPWYSPPEILVGCQY